MIDNKLYKYINKTLYPMWEKVKKETKHDHKLYKPICKKYKDEYYLTIIRRNK